MSTSIGRIAALRAVILPTALTLLFLSTIVGSVLHFSTSESDQLAAARQDRLVRIAIKEGTNSIATDQEASTYWNDAVIRTRQRPLDLDWIDNNLGVWFHTYYRHDETYLLDERNVPIYAMQGGRRVAPQAFRSVAGPARQLVDELRQQLNSGYLAPEGGRERTIGASEIAVVGNRPAIISVKPVVPETDDVAQVHGTEPLHISVRYLDRSFLARLSSLYGIDRARFSWTEGGAASVPLLGPDDKPIGYLTWTPFEPGEQVEDSMVPVLFAALLAVGLLFGLLMLRVWRSRSDLEASREEAQHLAFHDSLTGLPNRALFEDRLEHALNKRGHNVALLLLDLDRFKNVNDTLGHQAGDALIREFGLRLGALTRDSDTISRLGGDEFAIILEDSAIEPALALAKRILAEVGRAFDIAGAQVHIGASIGIARSSTAASDRLELVRRADIALYQAKDGGRNAYRLFTPDMDATVKLRGTIEEELRDALATGQGLGVHYQPQVDINADIIGIEALVRWDHSLKGYIPPEQFLPIAEETGLIAPLGEWVFRRACETSCRWPHIFVAVNLSPIQFRGQGFLETLLRIVAETGADPKAIQLEITERVLLDDDDSTKDILAKLRAAGFTIVLDDFGTGYSSLSHLRKFEVDKIKIDRSFVQHLGEASDSRSIVTAVMALGEALGLAVAAEGVETDEQRTFLKVAGCKEMQGHLFSRAVTAAELASLIDPGQRSAVA